MPGGAGALLAEILGLESLMAAADTGIVPCERESTNRY